jgi:hypothetical protein
MIARGIVAGAIAGVTILAYFALMNLVVLRTPGFTLTGVFLFDASVLIGRAAPANAAYVALGIGLHFIVSIGWALGYTIAAERQPQLLTRPLISGLTFGLIVYFAMQLVIVGANLYRIPTPGELAVALLAHTVFFGFPVAIIAARMQRPR